MKCLEPQHMLGLRVVSKKGLDAYDETFVILRGRVRVTTHRDDGSIIEDVVLCADEGRYGVNIPKGVWHRLEAIEPNSVIFECKEGPFVEHEVDGILELPKE